MKHIIALIVVLITSSFFNTLPVKSNQTYRTPCSLILEPTSIGTNNTKGVALIYKVKLTPSYPRTSISIHALHLPTPSSQGDYDSYEGFAFIPEEISWRFKLHPTPEVDGPTLAGRIDDISATLNNTTVQVRLANSKTNKLGPAILTGVITNCKS
jgi:hypothetical protein